MSALLGLLGDYASDEEVEPPLPPAAAADLASAPAPASSAGHLEPPTHSPPLPDLQAVPLVPSERISNVQPEVFADSVETSFIGTFDLKGWVESPSCLGSVVKERGLRVSKSTFNVHELDDPTALGRFLRENGVDERGSRIAGLYPGEDEFVAIKSEFARFVNGETTVADLLRTVAPRRPPSRFDAAPGTLDAPHTCLEDRETRRGKRSKWDER